MDKKNKKGENMNLKQIRKEAKDLVRLYDIQIDKDFPKDYPDVLDFVEFVRNIARER